MPTNNVLDLIWLAHQKPGEDHQALRDVSLSFEEGQAMQLELLGRYLDAGHSIGGWKIGMTSGASRDALGAGLRPFGFVLQDRIVDSGSQLQVAPLHRGQIENELCFLIANPLGAGATRESAMAAAEALVPAYEINQKRLPGDVTAGVRVADDLSNWGIIIGEPAPVHDDLSEMTVSLYQEDALLESVASPGHIDDHYQSLATLANNLAAYGHSLQPGQYVITGAYGKTPFAPGQYTGRFDTGVGDVHIELV